jgi:hypothetical protein
MHVRQRRDQRSPHPPAAESLSGRHGPPRFARGAETLALFLVLVVIGLRPLVFATYDSTIAGISARLTELDHPTPLSNLVLDGVVVIAALLLVAARSAATSVRYRRCGIEIGAIIVLVAGTISSALAGNKRLAINATLDWLCLPLLTIVLVQIIRARWQVRLLIVVVLASAAVQAAECWNQELYEFGETRRDYLARKAQIWGPEADPAHVDLFERRMAAAEATGFFEHSNVAAGYLLLTGIAGIGLAAGRWRAAPLPYRRGFALFGLVLAIATCTTLPLTGSFGSMVALGVAMLLLVVIRVFGFWIAHHRKPALLIGWTAVGLSIAATVTFGLQRGSLPISSLAFRWQYWTAAARMIADHPLTGVGRENFGRHYLRYKPIESPEEVANPHNFLVQSAAEWGVLGLVGIVVMLIGGSIAATRTSHEGSGFRVQGSELRVQDESPLIRSPLVWAAALAGAIFIARIALLGTRDPNYLIWETGFAGGIWLIAFFVLSLESDRYGSLLDDALPGLATITGVALFAFLLQDTINFALFVPGAATTFFALLAVPIALRTPVETAVKPWPRAALATAAIALLVQLVVTVPVARCQWALRAARQTAGAMTAGPLSAQPAYQAYSLAARCDSLDPTAPLELGRWLVTAAVHATDRSAYLSEAQETTQRGLQRDPFSLAAQRQLAMILRMMAKMRGEAGAWQAARDAYRRVLDLYPQNPPAYVELAEVEAEAGVALHDPTWLRSARAHYVRALQLDDARAPGELRRFNPGQRAAIQANIARVENLLVDQ